MILNVLSNTLYTRKAEACLREYGCNAYDANVEAGRGDTPIEVRLPNKLDCSLAIRDFGLGLTEEQVALTFCKLGRSTKRASNAFTGMLGIGSKAGFAYGDSFLVTSYVTGTKTVYNCFRDKGKLMMARMHQAPTDAPDGVEVKIPVKLLDIEQFRNSAERVFRYFKVQPKITGQKMEFASRTPELSGSDWRYIGNDNGRSVAIMGNVGYDLDVNALGVAFPQRFRTLLLLGVEIDFQIGDLEIAATREGLQYSDYTIKAVRDKLTTLSNEISKIFSDKIGSAKTEWEARRLYGDAFEKMGSYQRQTLRTVVDGKITWKGTVLNTARMDIDTRDKQGDTPKAYEGIATYRASRKTYGRGSISYSPHPEHIYASVKEVLCINDLPKKPARSPLRVKGFFDTNSDKDGLTVITFTSDKQQAQFFKDKNLDGVPLVNMSDIVPAAAAVGIGGGPSAHRSKHSSKVFTLDETAGSNIVRSLNWNTETVDLETDSGVFVVIDKFEVDPPKPQSQMNEHPSVFRQKVVALRKAGLLTGPVYGFKRDRLNKLGDGWVRLEVHIQTQIDKLLLKNAAQETVDFLAAEAHDALLPDTQAKQFPVGSRMHEYLTTLHNKLHPKLKLEVLRLMYSGTAEPWLPRQTFKLKPTVDFDVMEDLVRTAYPLLSRMDTYQLGEAASVDCVKEIAEYVKLIKV